jgi:hypothetical protein
MAIHSPEFQKKKKKRFKIFLISIVSIVILLLASLIYVSRIPKLLINTIEVRGNSVTTTDEIKKIVGEDISGKYMWLIPHSNAFLLPRSRIEGDLLVQIPRLKSVGMRVSSPGVLSIEVGERSPYALYCENAKILYSPDGCYFLDEEGYIFSKAPSFFGDVYFVYSNEAPIVEPLGKNFLPPEEFRGIKMLREKLLEFGVNPRMFEAAGDEYRLVLPQGGKIIWPLEDTPEIVLSNLEAFLIDPSVKKNENFLDQVLYIDMRFNNKIFYKLRETEE